MKIAICDDDFEYRKIIINNLETYLELKNEITEFSSAEDLLSAYRSGIFFDIIFMDVEMEKISGIEAGIEIRKYDPNAVMVFVSNYPKYAIPAYECEPLYFVLKPLESGNFIKVVNKAIEKYTTLHSFYLLKNRGDLIKIPIAEILYVEICRKHLIFHTSLERYETTGKIGETFSRLKPHGFCQVHQGYLVNMNHINAISNYDVIMDNGDKVMISVRKKSEVLKTYTDYLERIY